jgi:hypothetical protein
METIPSKERTKKYKMLSRETDADTFQAPAIQYTGQAHDIQRVRSYLKIRILVRGSIFAKKTILRQLLKQLP